MWETWNEREKRIEQTEREALNPPDAERAYGSAVLTGLFPYLFPRLLFLFFFLPAAVGKLFDWVQSPGYWRGVAAVASLYAAALMQAVIHELGHCVAGRLYGFRLISFQLAGVGLKRRKRKLAWQRGPMQASMVQCMMEPMDSGRARPVPYVLGGCAANLLAGLGSGALLLVTGFQPVPGYFLAALAAWNLGACIWHTWPYRELPAESDGIYARVLRDNPQTQEAFLIQLRVYAALMQGKRYRDLPDAWFDLAHVSAFSDGLLGRMALLAVRRKLDQEDYAGARKLSAKVLGDMALPEQIRHVLLCERIFCDLLMDKWEKRAVEQDALAAAREAALEAASAGHLSAIRFLYAYLRLGGETLGRVSAESLRKAFASGIALSSCPGEVAAELRLMETVQARWRQKRAEMS